MGSKRNPGRFDCYEAADLDEPMFVLLGRDKHAPLLVNLWAELRELEGEHAGKLQEARSCARWMRNWKVNKDAAAPEPVE